MSDVQKFGEEFQRVTKDGFDASVRSFGEVSKGFQAIAAIVVDYSKKSFEDSTRAFEQLAGAKSFEQAWEILVSVREEGFRGIRCPGVGRSARCMSIWPALPTGLWSKSLPRRPGRSRSA